MSTVKCIFLTNWCSFFFIDMLFFQEQMSQSNSQEIGTEQQALKA